MNEIKLHDFSSRVACDCEYKQAFPERVFPLAVAYGVCAHRKSATIQAPRCTERNEEVFDGRGGAAGGWFG